VHGKQTVCGSSVAVRCSDGNQQDVSSEMICTSFFGCEVAAEIGTSGKLLSRSFQTLLCDVCIQYN